MKRVFVLALVMMACGDDEPEAEVERPEPPDAASVDASRIDASQVEGTRGDAGKAVLDARVEAAGDARIPDASADAGKREDAGAGSTDVASSLSGLTLEAPCAADTSLPLGNGATCKHAGELRLSKKVTLGGDAGRVYEVRLRVRGIWEPTSIAGGMHDSKLPLTVGGEPMQGEPYNYQQWFIQVAKPKQTYWLNDYRYVAHDIHKEDYEATLRIEGGSEVTLVMNDGNDHQIANFPKETFSGAASTGQLLRIDVVSTK